MPAALPKNVTETCLKLSSVPFSILLRSPVHRLSADYLRTFPTVDMSGLQTGQCTLTPKSCCCRAQNVSWPLYGVFPEKDIIWTAPYVPKPVNTNANGAI